MVNGYHPETLSEAFELLEAHACIPYAGGTDLMLENHEEDSFLFLDRIKWMNGISEDDTYWHFGAALSFADLLDSPLVPKILKVALREIAAPAIRTLGTIGGNICNASPKADSALIFYATNALLKICSKEGERLIPIEDFYLGRNKTVLEKNELLTEIWMPKRKIENFYYKKIGARKALSIARLSFVGILEFEQDKISNCALAFGAISDTILRDRNLEALLIGKTIEEAKQEKNSFLAGYDALIQPIKGRVSAEYRKQVAMNLILDFLESNGISSN